MNLANLGATVSLILVVCCSLWPAAAAPQAPDLGAGELFKITLPIPERRTEVISAKPSPDHVWVPGHWDRSPGSWRWQPGEWRVPPFDGTYWVYGHWRYEGSGWRWTGGYWAVGDTPHVADEPIEAPTPVLEARPTQPPGTTDWIPGRWEWEGRWRWVLGRWVTRPHPRAEWTDGRWERRSTAKWSWVPGHWKVPE